MADPQTREQLEAGYSGPYRRWLPRLYTVNRLPWLVALAAVLWLVAALTGSAEVLAAAVTALVAVWALWVTAAGVRVIRARTAEWRHVDDSELGRARARRPHAAEADRVLAHDEYAVAVGDGGALVTWRYRPLPAGELPDAGETLLTGTPRYAATEAARTTHDARDAALAAEQLAAAQEDAAARERAAIERVHADLAALRERRELDDETASTGVALRRVTGQGPR